MQRNYLDELMSGGLIVFVKCLLLFISVQNTWTFIRTPEFVPNQNMLYSVLLFLLYEGGMVFWLHQATRTSNNPTRYIIAWCMFAISIAAVAMIMFYEMNGATLLFNHAFFVQYAPLITSNTMLAELLTVLLYETVNWKTYQHHLDIRNSGHFGELWRSGNDQQNSPQSSITLLGIHGRFAAAWDALSGRNRGVAFIASTIGTTAGTSSDDKVGDGDAELCPDEDVEMSYQKQLASDHISAHVQPKKRVRANPKNRPFDKTKVLLDAVSKQHPHATNNDLASMVDCSPTTVMKWRKACGSLVTQETPSGMNGGMD